jgi:hypothetical protein
VTFSLMNLINAFAAGICAACAAVNFALGHKLVGLVCAAIAVLNIVFAIGL